MSKSVHTTLILTLLAGVAIGWACNQSARVGDSWAADDCGSWRVSTLEIDRDEGGIQHSTNSMPVGIAMKSDDSMVVLLRECAE